MNVNDISNLKRPKICFSNHLIYISDPPSVWSFFLICTCLFLLLIAYESNGDSRMVGVISALALALMSIWKFVSLRRIRVDSNERVVYRKSINPVENMVDRILQHPSRIPFSSIEKVYADYTVAFYGVQRYYLYIVTDDPYKLNIAAFNKLVDAERVAALLTEIIRKGK